MTDPCLTCHLPLLPDGECQEASIDCPLHLSERMAAAALAVAKDSSMQVIRAAAAVRRVLSVQ